MTDELKTLLESVQRNRNCAQNSISRCRERILEIQKEMTYYEGQRDEADVIVSNIEKMIRGEQLPTPFNTSFKHENPAAQCGNPAASTKK